MFHSAFCLGTRVFPGLEWVGWPTACFCDKVLLKQSCHFVYIVFMATFMLQWQRWISATETKWPIRAKIFTFIKNSLPNAGLQEWQLFNKFISPSSRAIAEWHFPASFAVRHGHVTETLSLAWRSKSSRLQISLTLNLGYYLPKVAEPHDGVWVFLSRLGGQPLAH